MQEKGNHAKMVFLCSSFYLSSFIFIYCTCKSKLKYIVVNGFLTTKSYLIMVTWIAIINPSSRRGHEYVVAMKFKQECSTNYKI
jgi:hypothetical protein